jgi:MoaA/NifB/PqqE/SkfB family radical SAM enzyme
VDPTTRAMEDMPFEQLCKIIDDFYNLGTRAVWIQGGEPLLRDDIGKIVDYIKQKGIFCEIVTNGWFAEQKMDVLSKADKVCFSIDGDEETHDKIRRKGSHQRIISALKKAKKLGVNFRFNTVLNVYNMNKKNVDYLCNLAEQMGTGVLFGYAVLPIQKLNKKRDKKEHYFDKKSLQNILKYILECKRKGKPVHNDDKLIQGVINWNLPYHEVMYKHNAPKGVPQCLYGRLVCFLDVDGMIYPCAKYFRYKDKGMSVIKYGTKKAWKNISDLDCFTCCALSELSVFLSINPINMLKTLKTYLQKNI